MTIDKNHMTELLKSAQEMINNSKDMKAEMKAVMMALFAAVELILAFVKFPKNSQNSSVPPSQDVNRVKVPQTATGKKPGGQIGRKGTNLKKLEDPDEVIDVPVDALSLPQGRTYRKVESIVRQVVEMHLSRHVIEYRLEVSVKAKAVYMSQFQLIPYKTYSQETLGFMTEKDIPFTNNQGERDLGMTKVHQKVSGCFKSFQGAEVLCRIRSYLLTAQKHAISPTDPLTYLFNGDFTWLSASR